MKKVLSLLLVFAMLFVMAGCGDKGGDAAKGVNVYVEDVMDTLDPYKTDLYVSWYVLDQIYDTLLRIGDDSSVIPWLAKEYTVSDDGLTYTFKLNEGVKFHNGDEMKASDVAYSFNKAIEEPMMDSYTNMMEKAEATDDYTVVLTLNKKYAAVTNMIAHVFIVNEKAYSADSEHLDKDYGTGAYKLREGAVELASCVGLDAFADWFKGAPAIPTADLKIITDSSTARVQFESGDLDFLMVYNVSNYKPLQDAGKYTTTTVNAPHTAYVTWNIEKAPLDNVAFRQALTLATDKATINQIAYEGMAVPAKALFAETVFGADFSEAPDMSFNLEAAKAKLAEAGFPDGVDLDEYGVSIDYIGGSYHEKIANCLQEMWSQIGVHVSIQAAENVDTAGGNYTMRTTGVEHTADMSYNASKYCSQFIGSSNYARYANPKVDELFAKAEGSTDEAERKACYKEICTIITEECPYLCIQHKQMPFAWDKKLNAKVHACNEAPWYIHEWSWAE